MTRNLQGNGAPSRDTLTILSHCHELLPSELERDLEGGITAKLLVTSVDGRMYADREAWLASLESDAGLLASTLVSLDYIAWLVGRPDGKALVALEPIDLERARSTGKIALILGSEGSRFLEGKLEVLRAVYRLGYRYLAPMWFYDSAVGSAQDTADDQGLTEWGETLIREVNRLGMILDANHFSHRALTEALRVSRHPLLVSHTGALRLNPEARQLLPDHLLRAVADEGGVLGLMFQSAVIKPGFEQANMDHLIAQFEHCAELVGTEHIACGPDYLYNDPRLWQGNNPTGASPGPITWPKGLDDPSTFQALAQALEERGFTHSDIEAMFGANLFRLFESVRRDAHSAVYGDYRDLGDAIGVRTDGLTTV